VDNLTPQSDWPQPVEPQPERTIGGVRKVVATLGLSAMLLVVGGAAVALAASPDPSASPAPAATGTPGGTTAPGGGTTTPKSTHDCPNMGGSGTNRGTNRGAAPAPVTPTTPTTPSSTPSV
jgi:hypothetical protein